MEKANPNIFHEKSFDDKYQFLGKFSKKVFRGYYGAIHTFKILCQITVHKLCYLAKYFENLKNTIEYIASSENKLAINTSQDMK